MSVYCIKGETFRIHLEPIVKISDGSIHGFEALSRVVAKKEFDYEFFFRHLSVFELLESMLRQLEIYQKWCSQHHFYRNKMLFVNVNLFLLSQEKIYTYFVPFVQYFPISIEVDFNPSVDLSLDMKNISKNIIMLKKMGVELWLDDYFSGEDHSNVMLDILLSGVKLDKKYFWDMSSKQESFKKNLSGFFPKPIIVEGIETLEHLKFAEENGAELGQGYYWKWFDAFVNDSQTSFFKHELKGLM